MPIRPFIFVGVGGTGGKTLGVIRKTLDDTLDRIGWTEAWPVGWQFVHVDVPASPDTDSSEGPFALPRTCYVPLTTARSTYQSYHDTITQELSRSTSDATDQYLAWGSWRPEPPSAVRVEIPNGAGQFRALGRVCLLKSLKLVDQALQRAHDEASSAGAAPQLRRVQELLAREKPTSGDSKPVIFVVGSVAGGSGSGMLLDVVDVLRAQGHREISSIIFTPEVFEDPQGETEPGVAPNTFMALSEIANSMWTHAERDAPLSRDRLFGRAGVQHPVGHGGPSTAFLVGRRNRVLTFGGAEDVYKIVGRSLGELAMDERLTTEVIAYDIANGMAIAAGSTDNLGLSLPTGASDVPCFRGMGFSRLTVGRDFFDRYANDRLIRNVALRLLDGHLERRRPEDRRSNEELLEDVIQEVWPAFLRDSELDEVNENDALSDPLFTWEKSDVAAARAELTSKLRDDVTASGKKGKVQNAKARTTAASTVSSAQSRGSAFSLKVQTATSKVALELQARIQETLERVLLSNVASHGLPVAIGLMDRLIARSMEGVTSLDADVKHVTMKLTEGLAALPQPPAGAPAEFPVGSIEDIELIVGDALRIAKRYVQLVSLETAQEILRDLTENLLEPWRRALSDADGLLRLEMRPPTGRSPLELWPGEVGVPDYLRPSMVEFLLDDADGFPDQFVSVIERSVSGAKGLAAVTTATEQIISGVALGVGAAIRPVALVEQPWVPRWEGARAKGRSRATARVTLTLTPEDVKSRVRAWLSDQEKYVGSFLRHSVADYLTDKDASAPERKRRESRLVGHFESMIKSSLPLVALDGKMTSHVHGHDEPPYKMHVSMLNVPDHLGAVRSRLADAAKALLNTEQDFEFTNTPLQDAMMMTLLEKPYHMLEVASIMDPISRQWAQGGSVRELWQYRRARPLAEWVPLSPDARRAVVTGWFAARLMGQATATDENGTTVLRVGVGKRLHEVPRVGVRPPSKRDHVGMLLEALPAAMLACFDKKSLEGIELYQHLIRLSAAIETDPLDGHNPLVDWLQDEATEVPTDLTKHMQGGADRSQAAQALVDAWRATYEQMPQHMGNAAVAQTHPTYEVFGDVLEALNRIERAMSMRASEGTY